MYPRNFLCEEAKIKQHTPLKKKLCEMGEEAIWESRFTSFFSAICTENLIFKFTFYQLHCEKIFLKITVPVVEPRRPKRVPWARCQKIFKFTLYIYIFLETKQKKYNRAKEL